MAAGVLAALKGKVCKMAVTIQSVQPGSPCEKARVPAGGRLLQINGHEIDDVLDYRFYQNEKKLRLLVEVNGKKFTSTSSRSFFSFW